MCISYADLIGQKEICELLGWSKQQVNNYYKDGRLPIPVATVSGRPIWLKQHIIEYRDARK